LAPLQKRIATAYRFRVVMRTIGAFLVAYVKNTISSATAGRYQY
jgi:hypothetical protein